MPTGATRPSRGFSDTVADILRPVARVISTADKTDINSDAEETAEVVRRLISCEDHMGFLEGIGSLKMKDDLEKICRASYEGRRSREALMEQLAWGLSRSASWRESYSSLLVLEALASTGSKELWKECSVGAHFDVTQRLVLFGHFTSNEDHRVTRMIRAKASEVRDLVTDCYRAAEDEMATTEEVVKVRLCDCGATDFTQSARQLEPELGKAIAVLWERSLRAFRTFRSSGTQRTLLHGCMLYIHVYVHATDMLHGCMLYIHVYVHATDMLHGCMLYIHVYVHATDMLSSSWFCGPSSPERDSSSGEQWWSVDCIQTVERWYLGAFLGLMDFFSNRIFGL
ncbi:hypothetical protein FOZ62_010708 [Perkinsus olseni]|uniref:ENTH domain-containing protein n=1 Tax=Perkinsus olseni TaxID=32597 RepID=A0A7J6SZV8_PEROL|nr:hypothetical protein FOZ62_010708 [Perkinsus olseni]